MEINKLILPLLIGATLMLLACNPPGTPTTGTVQVFQGSNNLTSGGNYGFGSVTEGSSSAPVAFTIKNGTSSTVSITGSLNVSGGNAGDFSVGTPPSTSIPAGGSSNFTLLFSPTTPSAETASVALSSSSGSASFTLGGTGTTSGTLAMQANTGSGFNSFGSGQTVSMANYGPGPVTMDFHIINTHLTEPLFLVGSSALTMTNATGAFSIQTPPTSPVPPGGANFVDFAIQVVYLGHTKTYQETVTLKTSDAANQTFTFTVSSFQC